MTSTIKTKDALHIAEHLWADTAREGSIFDIMIKSQERLKFLLEGGHLEKLDEEVGELRSEVVARWANIIVEGSQCQGKHE